MASTHCSSLCNLAFDDRRTKKVSVKIRIFFILYHRGPSEVGGEASRWAVKAFLAFYAELSINTRSTIFNAFSAHPSICTRVQRCLQCWVSNYDS